VAKRTIQAKHNVLLILLLFVVVSLVVGFFFFKTHDSSFRTISLATTYTGTLPCADCSGLVTTLTLIKQHRNSGSYVLHELYEGKMTTPLVTEGKWKITRGSADNPKAHVLLLLPSDNEEVAYYLIDGETKLTMLNQEKGKIDSPFNETLVSTKAPPQHQYPGLANPASQNCTKVGGTLTMHKHGDGGEYGLCEFEDNMACEEWALFRGQCPVGGVKTTGYDTVEQNYCAWVGGKTLAEPNASCTLPNGNVCKDDALYNGTCQ